MHKSWMFLFALLWSVNGFAQQERTHFKLDDTAFEHGDVLINRDSVFAGKSTQLLPKQPFLQEIAQFLIKQDHLYMEVGVHISKDFDPKYEVSREKVDVQRAKAIRDYLIAQGVPSNRVTAGGYGFYDPLTPPAALKKMTDEKQSAAVQANNRIEYKIIGILNK